VAAKRGGTRQDEEEERQREASRESHVGSRSRQPILSYRGGDIKRTGEFTFFELRSPFAVTGAPAIYAYVA